MMGFLAATTQTIDLTGVEFTGITKVITELAPDIIKAVVAVLAVRKGIGFIYSSLRGA